MLCKPPILFLFPPTCFINSIKHEHSYGPRRERFANNTGTDQPAHLHSLISAFVIHFLESIISKFATSEISIFYLVPVAEETGLSLVFSETAKTGFLMTRPI